MASVNNPPNLKPLIDNQSTTQSTELTAAEQSIGAKVDAAKTSLETKANQTQQAVIDESTSIKSALAQSDVSGEAATNAARDFIISSLGVKFDEGADFDIYHLKTLNTLGLNRDFPKLQVYNTVMEKVYERVGGGAITYLRINDRIVLDIFIDGVKVLDKQYNGNQVYSDLIPSVIPYLKYKNSVEIYANTNDYTLTFIDWRVY